MRCPYCTAAPSDVKQTTRPLNEGLEHGDIKRRLRKCRNCRRMFTTFEIHEDYFRKIRGITEEISEDKKIQKELKRRRLLVKEVEIKDNPTKSRIIEMKKRHIK